MTSKHPKRDGKAAAPTPLSVPPSSTAGDTLETLVTVLWALIFAGVIRIFLFEAFQIEGPSMEPTLYDGDRVLVSKFSYGVRLPFKNEALASWALPNAGDVVIVTGPRDNVDIVKRVVGLPGDTIAIKGGVVHVNGAPIGDPRKVRPCEELENRLHDFDDAECVWNEEFVGDHAYRTSQSTYYEYPDREWPPIPEGHLFVMGDHRDESNDSRTFGPVSARRLKGRALAVYWSGGWPWSGTTRWARLGHVID